MNNTHELGLLAIRRSFLCAILASATLVLVGCKSTGTQMTFKRPYPEVRIAIQALCQHLESPAPSQDLTQLSLSLEPPRRLGAWISGTNEVPDQSYAVVVWDQIASFPTAPHMEIRADRISAESTRVSVLSKTGSQSSALIMKRRVEHEAETLEQLSDILSRQ